MAVRTLIDSGKQRLLKLHEAPHTVAQLYGLPHGILHVFNTILYEKEFQNLQQTIMSIFFPSNLL
jgi:hypothetical protein